MKLIDLFNYTLPGEWGTQAEFDNSIPVLRSTNFRNDGKIDYSNIEMRSVPKVKLEPRKILKGDLLIEKSGGSTNQAAGRVVYSDTDFGGTASNFIEIAKVKDCYDAKYVFYLMYHLYQRGYVMPYQQQTTGLINFKLNEYLSETSVDIAKDKDEQVEIARILSTSDEAIEQTEQLIAKYQRIKTGLMQDLLTKGIDKKGNIRNKSTHNFIFKKGIEVPEAWDVYSIEEITEYIGSGITPKGGSDVYSTSGVMLLRSQNILNGLLDFSDVAYVSEEINAGMRRSQLVDLDVLLNITGASIGRSHFVPIDFPKANVNQHVCAIRLKNTSIGKAAFVSNYLNSPKGQNQIKRLLGASNREGLNYQQIREIKVAMPKIEFDDEFERIQKVSSAINNQIDSCEQQRIKLVSIKAGLMQDLLSGKVRVKM